MRSLSKIKINAKREFRQWLKDTYNENTFFTPRPPIVCNDGFTMSVQGGQYLYSNPRGGTIDFVEMEVGFPSEYEELISGYSEGDDYTLTVYPYVPVELIIEVIQKHGGMKKNKK